MLDIYRQSISHDEENRDRRQQYKHKRGAVAKNMANFFAYYST
jgi:hypothetical protein